MAVKTHKTHIGKIREQYACNRQSILTALGWDEDSYNNAWIDMGKLYLNSQYPENDPRFAEYYNKAAKDRKYWQWWYLEWKHREDYFVSTFKGDIMHEEDYLKAMQSLVLCYTTDKSFEQNYLKL